MSNTVFANGKSIACKAGEVKVVAAFPDVCQSPPGPPTGPVPVPYASSSSSRDLRQGSESVKVGGRPIALKKRSYIASSPLGNEAATRSFGAGVSSHQTTGKTYFAMWSMNVRAEGLNLCRHLDLTTSNHGSNPNTPPLSALGSATVPDPSAAKEQATCECCGLPIHEGQLDEHGEPAPVVSEDEWYMTDPSQDQGLEDELEQLCDNEPSRRHKSGVKRLERELDKLVEREAALVERREVLELGREMGCLSLPEPPCDVYRLTPEGSADKIGAKWDEYRKTYQIKYGYPPLSTTNHRVPKSAGGCPGNADSEGNLVHDQELGADCRAFDHELLTLTQTRCAELWHKRRGALL